MAAKRKISRGDRFCNEFWGTWEATGENVNKNPTRYYANYIDGSTKVSVKYDYWDFLNHNNWEYIGNYDKSNSFKTIYNILNNGE
jgi:hypothetical protein